MNLRFCMGRTPDNDPRPSVNRTRLPSRHWAIDDFFDDIETRYPFTFRHVKHVPSANIHETVLGMMLATSETMPHQLNPFLFTAHRHLFSLQLSHVVPVTSAQCHSLLDSPATISSSD